MSDAKQMKEEYQEKEKKVHEKRRHLKKQLNLITVDISDLTSVSRGLKKGKIIAPWMVFMAVVSSQS